MRTASQRKAYQQPQRSPTRAAVADDKAHKSFRATGAAFVELCDAVTSHAGLEGWERLLLALPLEVRAVCESYDLEASFDERLFAVAVHTADDLLGGGNGAVAREIGRRRADEVLASDGDTFTGDPLRFLKIGAALFYRNRANYGAAGLELTDSKAIVRFIFPGHFTLKVGNSQQRMSHMVLGFLEHVLQVLSSTPQPGRYIGHALRAEPRFGQQMYNQHYEFALDHD